MMRRFPTPWMTTLPLLAALALIGPMRSSLARAEGDSAQTPPAAAPPGAAAPAAGAPASGTPANEALPGLSGDLVDAEPFDETTAVVGKVDNNLQGVWLLVAMAEVAKGKFKNFPQLIKITKGKNGLEVHLLDVRMPASIDQSILQAKRTIAAWVPTPDELKLLSKEWSHLPPAKQKARDEFLYMKNQYTIAAPNSYSEAFPQRSEQINKALDNSKLGMKFQEDYRPRPASTKFPGAQVMRRNSYYGAKTVAKDVIKGDMITGFVAAGAGTPLPLDFMGTFAMYRLSSK